MPRTGGEATKARIMAAAERLFARNGFSATSVDDVAAAAGVNKALIYYYFRNKEDLFISLFKDILAELKTGKKCDSGDISLRMAADMRVIERRKAIIAVILMEALKSGDKETFLFQCCEELIPRDGGDGKKLPRERRRKLLVEEFFTGMMPYAAFVLLKDKWCRYFHCDMKQLEKDFYEAFIRSHLKNKS